jgi:hypothetical protein
MIVPVAKAMPVAGPVLHGDYVAWGEGGIREGEPEPIQPIRVFVASPGASARLVYEQRPTRGRPEWWFGDFAGSTDLVAFERRWTDCGTMSCDLQGDAAAAGLDRDSTTLSPVPCDEPTESLDVDDTRVAFVEKYCVSRELRARVRVDDLADSERPRTVLDNWDGWAPIRIAGRFLAWSDETSVVVYDLEKARISYTARLPGYTANGVDLDVQADGKVVAAWGNDGENARLAWFAPEEPTSHPIPAHARLDQDRHTIVVRLGGDRVAFERGMSGEKTELVVADLDGKLQHIASFDRLHPRIGDFDFDGQRLTWASQRVDEFKEECNAQPGHWQRECWKRGLGPTTIYTARLD